MKRITKKQELKLKKKSLKHSIHEGSWSSVMNGFGTNYITPFALTLKASNFQIGLISSFVGLITPLSQLYGSRLMEKKSRKTIVVKYVFLQALLWLPILFLVLLAWQGIGQTALPWMLILFYIIMMISGSIATPAWFSWMGDLIPENKRGKYFSTRNKVNSSVLLVSMLLASFLMDFFRTKGIILAGYGILFAIAFTGRMISQGIFRKHYEPKLKLEKGYYFSFSQFVKTGIKTNFGKFTSFVALLYLSVMVASPFFAVYMLEELQLSYKLFIIITASTTFYSLIFLSALGKISDKIGNKFLLKLAVALIAIHPILWTFSSNIYYLIFMPQLLSGLGWAAFGLSSANFIYENVKPIHRGLCITYYNVLIGIGVFFGAIIGGLLAQNISLSFISTFLFVFIISGILRLLMVLIFIPQIKETRKFKKTPHFHLSMLNPTTELNHDFIVLKKTANKLSKKILNLKFET